MFNTYRRMRASLCARLSFANVVSVLALFIALGGGAYAATQLPRNSVGTKQLRNGAVTLKKIARHTRTSLRGPRGATGAQGSQGSQGPKGDKGNKGDAGTSVFANSIPSGTTIAGAWGGRYIAPQLAFNNSYLISTSFPVKAPQPLADTDVNTAPNGTVAKDPDTTCTGSANNPTAPKGKVCIYISNSSNAGVTGFRLTNPGTTGTAPGDAYGFIVRILDAGTVGNTSTVAAEGTWAYTAP